MGLLESRYELLPFLFFLSFLSYASRSKRLRSRRPLTSSTPMALGQSRQLGRRLYLWRLIGNLRFVFEGSIQKGDAFEL